MPPTTNPYLVALYLAVTVAMIPGLRWIWHGATFFVRAIDKLDKIDQIDAAFAEMKEEREREKERKSRESHSLEMDLSIIEGDINVLQLKAGIDKRQFPDRRIGPADRRTA